MDDIMNLIKQLSEDEFIELKKAENSFPTSALETYSAMANTSGGWLILGLTETKNGIEPTGITDSSKIKSEMFNLLNNPEKVSANILSNQNIQDFLLPTGENIIIVNIPEASFADKPIHLNKNYRQSYKRNHEGDYLCTDNEIKLMIRDSSSASFDSSPLSGYSINDLDEETIRRYRSIFKTLKPGHPFIQMTDELFLKSIGALTLDRTYNNGLIPTLAGLLVFGRHSSIKSRLSSYHIEYIHKGDIPLNTPNWRDRVVYDGSWGEGNLFNFFHIVFEKLVATLEIPLEFDSKALYRDDSHDLRIAIREALVNSIIHADYYEGGNVQITRMTNQIIFSNSGTLRISKKQFFQGGASQPRNHFIQEIFRHINLSERAGSGVPRILETVRLNSLAYPEIQVGVDFFTLKLWDTSWLDSLDDVSSKEKAILSLFQKLNLITRANVEKELNLSRTDAINSINSLREKGYLRTIGSGRSTKYDLMRKEPYEGYGFITKVSNLLQEIIDKN